jgi:hypothetical protein
MHILSSFARTLRAPSARESRRASLCLLGGLLLSASACAAQTEADLPGEGAVEQQSAAAATGVIDYPLDPIGPCRPGVCGAVTDRYGKTWNCSCADACVGTPYGAFGGRIGPVSGETPFEKDFVSHEGPILAAGWVDRIGARQDLTGIWTVNYRESSGPLGAVPVG